MPQSFYFVSYDRVQRTWEAIENQPERETAINEDGNVFASTRVREDLVQLDTNVKLPKAIWVHNRWHAPNLHLADAVCWFGEDLRDRET